MKNIYNFDCEALGEKINIQSRRFAMVVGEYYTTKCKEIGYSEKMQKCIKDACQYCIDNIQDNGNLYNKGEHPLMMFGKIQSGKTRAFTGLMALAFDNKFDYVFILTKNNKALVEQTYKRMRSEFKVFLDRDEVEVSDIMKLQDELTPYELNKKLIIIAKKQKDNLARISNFIKYSMINGDKNCLIIDDEADTTSIGYEKMKDSTDEFNLRTVASEVNKIRGSLDGCVFVQVTATPYALYLQPEFDGIEIKPIKPLRTVMVPSGDSYIGGEYYFLKSNEDDSKGRFIFEEISDEEQEISSAKTTDRRRFKEEEILIREDRMSTFKRGIVNFIMGGCIMKTNGYKKKYAYVIHTAVAQQAHDRIANITKILIEQIKECREEYIGYINKLLLDSYKDMSESVIGFGFEMPPFEVAKDLFFQALQQGVKISVINAKDDINKYLDEDTGELKLRTPFSIFVGGQVLDRGITIPNMVGFYYARNPKTMQQDTVMQHSRMFGYRGDELLAITRFYTTKRIYECMVRITQIDAALRDDIENERFEDGLCFIERRGETPQTAKIVPCSPSKILLSNVVYLKPSSRVLPVGFLPKAKAISDKVVKEINEIIDDVMAREQKEASLISVDEAEKIIEKVYSCLSPDDDTSRFVTSDRMISVLRYVAKQTGKCYLIVRRNRNMSKYGKENRYIDAPEDGNDERRKAREIAIDIPCLTLLHQSGKLECWKEREFWWPILTIPKNTPKTIYALPDIEGHIRKK